MGKSSVLALVFRQLMAELRTEPDSGGKRYGGRVFFASTTIEQIKLDILPEVKKKLRDLGLHEGIHYVDCKQPPEWFDKPLSPPEDFDNCVTFFTGFYIHLKSTIRWRSKKGGSYDGGILDEAAETNGGMFKKIFLPSIRGNRYRFKSHWHYCKIILSNRPNPEFPAGYWIYDFKKQAEENPQEVFYLETSALDNKDVLGEEWFEEQRLMLGEDAYAVSILNQEQRQLPTGFYHKLDRKQHCYVNGPGVSDVRGEDLLELSFDFGGKFNCCTVWQEHEGTERCLRQFYVKREGKISTLVQKVCQHYRMHHMKYVRVWGEPRGHDKDPGRADLYQIIQQKFEEAGWMCEVRVQPGYKTKGHKVRYEFMQTLLSESSPTLPIVRFNEEHCGDVLIALERCDVDDNFQKIKTMEKDPNFPQEHAPHFTDTVDYYLYEKHSWRLLTANSRAGGVW